MAPTDLVTGGSGFIGGHLVRRLHARGRHVRVLDTSAPRQLPPGADFVAASVTDAEAVATALRGVDRVFHLAALSSLWAPDKSAFDRVIHQGTRTLLAAADAAGVATVVHCSTEAILKPGHAGATTVTDDVEPRLEDMPGPYCRAKLLAEQAAFAAAREGRHVVVVNPTVPLGPGDRHLTPPARMLLGFLNGEHPAYLETTLNLVDVRDVAEGHVRAAEHGMAGRRYILGGGDVRLSELLRQLARLSGRPMPRHRVPYWLAWLTGALGELVADHVTGRPPTAPLTGVRLAGLPVAFSNRRAREELGVAFRPLAETLAETLADFRSRGLLTSVARHG